MSKDYIEEFDGVAIAKYTKEDFHAPAVLDTANRVSFLIAKTQENYLEIAYRMGVLSENKDALAADDCKDIAAFGKRIGMGKSTAYSFAQMGLRFVGEFTPDKGKKKSYVCTLKTDGKHSWSSTQLGILLPYEDDFILRLIDDGTISSGTSTRALKEILKTEWENQNKTDGDDTTDGTDTDTDDTTDDTDDTTDDNEVYEVFDDFGNSYRVPVKILSQYLIVDVKPAE